MKTETAPVALVALRDPRAGCNLRPGRSVDRSFASRESSA